MTTLAPLRFKCTACEATLQIPAATTAKKIKCSRCKIILPLTPPAPTDDVPEIEPEILADDGARPESEGGVATIETFAVVDDSAQSAAEEPVVVIPLSRHKDMEPDQDEEEPSQKATGQSVSNPLRVLLLVLLAGYFPFLAVLTLGLIGVGLGLIVWGIDGFAGPDGFAHVFGIPGAILGAFLILTAFHVLLGLTALFWKADDKDDLEIELPEQWQEGLIDLVKKVADKRDLPVPDAIRLHAVSVAHVYEDRKNRSILVLGGLAVVALPHKAVAGIIAHELGHCGAGDTGLSRLAFRWHLVIDKLESRYAGRSWHNFNPLTWVLRVYHWTYILAWFANQRRQELAADQHEIEMVGRKDAAATLVLLHVFGNMKGTDLGSVAESYVQTNERLDQIFAEQVRRIRVASKMVWEDALKKAMREKTGWLDSHPCLKERLAAIGVVPKKALRLAMDLSGEPSTALFANWPLVEKFLTRKIVDIVRENYHARKDYIDTVAAVMRASERAGS